MRVILEGIDGAGKSTLLKRLGTPTELGKPPKSVTPAQWADMFRTAYEIHPLLSRCHVSEQVYGSLIRKKSLIDDWQAWLLNMQLRARKIQVIWIIASLERTRERILSRKETASDYDLWVIEHYEEMMAAYSRLLPADITEVVSNNGDIEEAVFLLTQKIRLTPKPPLRGIGWPEARVMVVGEEFTRRRWEYAHAVPFDSGDASRMVYEGLRHFGSIFLTNAVYPDLGPVRSQVNLMTEYRTVKPRVVITLGGIARDACRESGIKVDVELAHPQYWRRFKYASREDWIQTLTDEVRKALR